MRRTNRLAALPLRSWQKSCICEWLAASCAFYNEINYRRRQAHFESRNWRDVQTSELYDKYAAVTGVATAQTLVRKNAEAWESFEALERDTDSKTSPPGYWGNREDGYPLRSVVRNDCYEITWDGTRSTIEIPVGRALNTKYDIPGRGYRVTLEIRGMARWEGKPGRLDINYDELANCFRVNQPVAVQPDLHQSLRQSDFTPTLQSENTDDSEKRVAALDIGANNTLSIVTDAGEVAVFQARTEFKTFSAGLAEIDELQSRLPDQASKSARICLAYRRIYHRRNHHRDACVKRAAEWLVERDIARVLVGDLTDVLDTHWSPSVNQKTHNFWSHGQLTDRLIDTFAVHGIELTTVSEAGTSSTCPNCDGKGIVRHLDTLTCPECGVETHADIAGAALILASNTELEIAEWFQPSAVDWPMARPAPPSAGRYGDGHRCTVTYLQWDDHEWKPVSTVETGTLGSFDQRGVSKPASASGAMAGCVAHGGISAS